MNHTPPAGGPEEAPVPGGVSQDVLGVVVRLRMTVAYDGTDFSGWARQPGRRTVQEELETALGRLFRLDPVPQLTVAGRTDAGVHARGQVVHVDVPVAAWEAVADRAVRGLGGLLPADVRVRTAEPAAHGFDARFSALWRRYAYRVSDTEGGVDPLRRRDVLWHRRPLSVERMNEAAALLVGEHDFAAFCRRREGATTVRELLRLEWARDEDMLVGTVQADAFCHNMVRALVGAMLAVGDGRRAPAWPAEVLRAGVRDSAVHVVAPHGLTLEEVAYPPDSELAARANATRRLRPVPGTS